MLGQLRSALVSQERIVLLTAVALFCLFSVFLKGFLSAGNMVTLVRGVATLGILGVGMAIVVIGRGVDLAIVTTYAMSAAWTLHLASLGVAIGPALMLGFLLAVIIGVINGVLIAYVEIPALFATLGMAALVYGFVRWALVPLYVVYLPPSANVVAWIGGGFLWGAPTPILFFALIAFLSFVFLRFTKQGRFIYAIGDNFAAAHIRRAGALGYRPAIYDRRVNCLSRRHDHSDGGLEHEHRSRDLADDLRRHSRGGARRHQPFRRPRRHPQRARRHAADRHSLERHDDHEHRIHAAECDPEPDPSRGHRARQSDQPSG